MIDALLILALAIVSAGTLALLTFLGWVALCCAADVWEARRHRQDIEAVRRATGREPE